MTVRIIAWWLIHFDYIQVGGTSLQRPWIETYQLYWKKEYPRPGFGPLGIMKHGKLEIFYFTVALARQREVIMWFGPRFIATVRGARSILTNVKHIDRGTLQVRRYLLRWLFFEWRSRWTCGWWPFNPKLICEKLWRFSASKNGLPTGFVWSSKRWINQQFTIIIWCVPKVVRFSQTSTAHLVCCISRLQIYQ